MVLEYQLLLLQGLIFAHDIDGPFSVLYYRVLYLQCQGIHSRPHNVLFKENSITFSIQKHQIHPHPLGFKQGYYSVSMC